MTYLQHSDPAIPYYREYIFLLPSNIILSGAHSCVKGQWTFLRGALATVDRPIFGWVGRFFWHDVSSSSTFSTFASDRLCSHIQIAHDRVAHHFFIGVPFCECSRSMSSALTDHVACGGRQPRRGDEGGQARAWGALLLQLHSEYSTLLLLFPFP